VLQFSEGQFWTASWSGFGLNGPRAAENGDFGLQAGTSTAQRERYATNPGRLTEQVAEVKIKRRRHQVAVLLGNVGQKGRKQRKWAQIASENEKKQQNKFCNKKKKDCHRVAVEMLQRNSCTLPISTRTFKTTPIKRSRSNAVGLAAAALYL